MRWQTKMRTGCLFVKRKTLTLCDMNQDTTHSDFEECFLSQFKAPAFNSNESAPVSICVIITKIILICILTRRISRFSLVASKSNKLHLCHWWWFLYQVVMKAVCILMWFSEDFSLSGESRGGEWHQEGVGEGGEVGAGLMKRLMRWRLSSHSTLRTERYELRRLLKSDWRWRPESEPGNPLQAAIPHSC